MWVIVLRKKLGESLTARIFLITFVILLCSGAVTFGLIAWATPSTYTSVVNDELQTQTDRLVERLSETEFEDCGPVLDEFIRASRADVVLLAPGGELAETGSELAVNRSGNITVAADEPGGGSVSASWGAERSGDDAHTETIATLQQYSIVADVFFAGSTEAYGLYVTPHAERTNPAVGALIRMIPWLLLVLLMFSLICAIVYSRYITRPVVRISGIAKRMAELDFNWRCAGQRRDEIGTLSRSLDRMAERLSSALSELKAANSALRGEVELERELDRQRADFFSAASHELKTPLTILKGQLSGMLEEVGVYRDRDKYLLRALGTAERMEELIGELLSVSRIETGASDIAHEPVELSALIKKQLARDIELMEQRGQRLETRLAPGVIVTGDASLLGKAIENLLSNAIFYSNEGAVIRVWCGMSRGKPAFIVENTGVSIDENALPHIFEPFYRAESSRNRSTGGSGLGLYLVRTILERHRASCVIENIQGGVRASVFFP